jgi:uncharacterized membrane protein HdeD (DUF308 family)
MTSTHLGEHRAEIANQHSAWHLAQGILLVFAGVLALIFPVVSTVTVTLVIGWVLIFSGIFQAISLIRSRESRSFGSPSSRSSFSSWSARSSCAILRKACSPSRS